MNNNVDIYYEISGLNLLVFAAKYLSGKIIDEIFKNDTFDYNNYKIIEAFINSFSKPLEHSNTSSIIKIMGKIYKYDLNHSHLIDFTKLLENRHLNYTNINY